MTVTDERLAEALRARADWLDLPRDLEAPRPYIAREQFRAAADRLDERPSLIAEVERLREALRRYQYAAQWTAADAWDFCGDCQERIRWAHAHDPERLSVNEVAEIGKSFLSRTALQEPGES